MDDDLINVNVDLDKAPPHVEGELLKRKTKAVLAKWQRRFFVVHRDKLQYYSKREDYKLGKEPLNVVRLLRVKDITESVFNGVPKKHHINCGFTIVELLPRGEEVVYQLLAETPDLMRYWVHALRYIRSYWLKLEVRDTVLNDEQERRLLDRLLREEEIEDDMVFVGEYSMEDDSTRQGSAEWDTKQLTIPVNFADGSKVPVHVQFGDSVNSIIEKVQERVTSSNTQLWVVNSEGKEFLLNANDDIVLYHPSAHQFFLVDPACRILVVFIPSFQKEFVATIVSHKITAQEVIEHSDIATKLDIAGIANRGLFLQNDKEALLFDASECPCDALFIESDGQIKRNEIGRLIIKNKALERGMTSKKVRETIRRPTPVKPPVFKISEEEESDHRRALDKIQRLRDGKVGRKEPQKIPEDDAPPDPSNLSNLSPRLRTRSKAFIVTANGTSSSMPKVSKPDSPSPKLKRRSVSPSPQHVPAGSPPLKRPTINLKKEAITADVIAINESRSSGFGRVRSEENEVSVSDKQLTEKEEEERLNNLFSASYQENVEEELKQKIEKQMSADSLLSAATVAAATTEESKEERNSDEPPLVPFVVSVDNLSQFSISKKSQDQTPVVIHRPSILKVILLQTESAADTQTMKLISLSGVVLKCINGSWRLYEENNFHNPPEEEEEEKEEKERRELYTLPGGIRTVYDPLETRWYVLPPLQPSPASSRQSSVVPEERLAALQTDGFSDDFYLMKRTIATNIGSSFMDILNLFNGSLSADEKKRIASDMTNEHIGHMIRGKFCTSLASLLLDGVKLQKLGGLIQYDVWKLVNTFCQEGVSMSEPSATSLAVESQVMRPIRGESRIISNDMKFRSFVCLVISRGLFLQWLAELPQMGDTLRKHYTKNALLYMVHCGEELYCKLFDEILLSLQPMSFFPFQLSIDFEIKCFEKTRDDAATKPNGSDTVDSSAQRELEESECTSIINESHINERESAPVSGSGLFNAAWKQRNPPQWFKNITYNLSNLNMGGAISGPPPKPSSATQLRESELEWKVIALHDCSADDEDELSFQKGEVLYVKKEINSEWLFCQKDDDTKGIVPCSFVQKYE